MGKINTFPLEYILSGIFYVLRDQIAGTGSPDCFALARFGETVELREGAYYFRSVNQELVFHRLVYIQSCPGLGVLLCP